MFSNVHLVNQILSSCCRLWMEGQDGERSETLAAGMGETLAGGRVQRLEPWGEEVGSWGVRSWGKMGVLWGGKGALGEEWGRGGDPWIPVCMLLEQAPACCGCMSELSSSPSGRGPRSLCCVLPHPG